jgi:hypothetical protein
MKTLMLTSNNTPYLMFAAAGLALLATACLIVWSTRRNRATKTSERRGENVLTLVAAALATAVSSTGMWRFFGHSLHLYGPLRIALFAFIEVGMLAEALRARRNVRDPEIGSAGVDGIAVWALAASSGLFSAMDAGNLPGAAFRLGAPLFAAWLWERGMAIERRKSGGRRIHWRITPERILVRLGIAEASDRTASEVDAHRRLAQLARAAKQVRALKDTDGKSGRKARAAQRLDRAMDRAVEHAGLAADSERQKSLLAQLGALYNASTLADLAPTAPWNIPVPDDIDAIRAQAAADAQTAIAQANAQREADLAVMREEVEQLRAQLAAAQEETRVAAEQAAEQAQIVSGAREHVEYANQEACRAVNQAMEQARKDQQVAVEAAARAQAAEAVRLTAEQAAEQARTDLNYHRTAAERQLADLRDKTTRAEQLAEAERAERAALADELALLRTELRMERQRAEELRTEKEAAEAVIRMEREKTAAASRTGNGRTGAPRTGGTRTGAPRTGSGDVDREEFVAEQTAEILAALQAGEDWKPDYDDLMQRTGFKRSWCEKVVADAKRRAAESALRNDSPDERTDQARTDGTTEPRIEGPNETRTGEPESRTGDQQRTDEPRTDDARTPELAGVSS